MLAISLFWFAISVVLALVVGRCMREMGVRDTPVYSPGDRFARRKAGDK
jgi:hypothetical protein